MSDKHWWEVIIPDLCEPWCGYFTDVVFCTEEEIIEKYKFDCDSQIVYYYKNPDDSYDLYLLTSDGKKVERPDIKHKMWGQWVEKLEKMLKEGSYKLSK